MGFVKNEQKDITVPGGTGTIRKLSARSLDKASEARQISQSQSLRNMGGDVVKALFRGADTEKPKAEKPDYEVAKQARYALYDRGTVLAAGIVRWSFSDAVPTDPLDVLDDETAQAFHEGILDFSLKPIDPSEYEVARGKDSTPSMNS